VKPYDITRRIERTFQHMAAHHAQEIQVEVKGGKVILRGVVRAWIEKAEAEEAAREVPGVKEAENRLEVTPLLEGKEKAR
jgi:osmotically-inducible protein OsmY